MSSCRLRGRLAALARRLAVCGPCPRCRERAVVVVPVDGVLNPPVCPQCGGSPLAGPVKVYLGVRVADV
jgi:hypothetical protein